MQDHEKKLRQYSENDTKKRKSRLYGLLLSVVVVISVVSSLIMPAISATRDDIATLADTGGITFNDKDGTNQSFGSFTPVSASIAKDNKEQDKNYEGTGEGADATRKVSFQVDFNFATGSLANRYIYCEVTGNVDIPEGGLPAAGWGEIKDDKYTDPNNESHVSGYYKIIEQTGADGKKHKYILIEFKEDYAKKNATSVIDGKVEFDADVKRNNDELDDTAKVIFGDKTVQVKGYTQLEMSVGKSGNNNAADKNITWTITVSNPRGGTLNSIEDEQFKNAKNIKVTPEGAGTVDDNGNFTFAEGCKEKEVKIEYTAPYPTDPDFVLGNNNNAKNKAKLTYDNDKTAEKNANVWVSDNDEVSKTGKADFVNNTITWTVTVDNKRGADLKDYILKDEAFASSDTTNIKLVDSSGKDVLFTRENDKLVLGSTTDSKLTLTYTTPLDTTTVDNKNKVWLQAPNTTDDSGKSAEATVKSTNFAVSKNGWTSDPVNGEIKWSITIEKFNESESFKDKVVKDDMFANAKGGKITVNADGKNYDVTVDADGNITLPDVGSASKVTIEYVTKVTDIDLNADVGTAAKYKNTVGFEGLNDTKEVVYKPQDQDSKWYDNLKQTGDTVTMNWYVEFKHTKGNFKGKTVTDKMKAADQDGNELNHTTTADSFKLFYNTDGGSNYNELPADWYTLTVAEDGKSYEIKFADKAELDNVANVKVQYVGTINVANVKQGTMISFKNSARYNNKYIDKDGTFDIQDKGSTPYQKLDAETGSSERSEKDLKSLPTVTIDGVKYYRFDWKIVVNDGAKYSGSDSIDLVDTLPSYMKFYDNDEYLWFIAGNDGKKKYGNDTKWYGSYRVDNDNNQVHFTINDKKTEKWEIYYSTIAKVEDVKNVINTKGYIDFNNKLQDKDNGYEEISQTQTVKEKNVTKASAAAKDGCEIKYTVEVNPKALDLSKGDTLTLIDLVKCANTATRKYHDSNKKEVTETIHIDGNSAVDMQLKNIKITDMNSDKVLSTDEYSYTMSDADLKTVQYTSTARLDSFDNNQATIYITPESGAEGASSEVTVKVPDSYADGKINHYYVSYGYIKDGYFNQISGTAIDSAYSLDKKEVTIPLNASEKVIDGNYQKCFKIDLNFWNLPSDAQAKIGDLIETAPVFSKQERDYAKKLELTVPDSKHLKIEYTYSGHPANTEDATNESFVVDTLNNISFDTSAAYITENDSARDSFELIDQSKGTSSTVQPFNIEKVDGGDYSLKLNASFKLWKYAKIGETGNYGWIAATNFSLNQIGDRNVVTWGDSEDTDGSAAKEFDVDSVNDCALQLEAPVQTGETQTGYLYKLVETKAPGGYQLDDTPIYFAYRIQPEQLPQGITANDYQFVQNGDVFKITNLVDKVNIEADKVWSDGNDTHTTDKVTFTLYKSTTRQSSGLPEDAIKVTVDSNGNAIENPVELSASNSWKYTWPSLNGCERLSNGTAYKQIYYYIEESHQNLQTGKTYTTVYNGNAARKSGTITVTNMTGLTIIKNWKDENGNALDEAEIPQDSIDVDVYQSTVAPNSPTRVNGENGLPTDCTTVFKTVNLSKADGWKTVLDNLPQADNDGNKYYYYVIEKTVPSGFSVNYTYENNAESIGTATITNTIATVDVDSVNVKLKKLWSDGDSKGHSGDKLTFNIYRSLDSSDAPDNFNSFTGNVTQKVKFEVYPQIGDNVTVMAKDGEFADSYEIENDGSFRFDLTNAWLTGRNQKNNQYAKIQLVKSDGSVLDEIYCTNKDGTSNALTWDKTSSHVSVDYVQTNNPYFDLKLKDISEDITVKIFLEGYSNSTYKVTADQTVSGGVITPVDSNDPYTGSTESAEYWKTVTVTADNNWSADIELEKTDSRGRPYYYWFEEVTLNGTDISKTNYTPYYKYNGNTDSFIDPTKTGQSVNVYNKYVRRTGKLPSTGGRGVAGFVVAGGALSATAAALLIAKRRRRER